MDLYSRYVNYSVFDGEITLSSKAKQYLLNTIFYDNNSNLDIHLLIDNQLFSARLMNVPSSSSIQISYGIEVQKYFIDKFKYSYDYWKGAREAAKKEGLSTRKIPIQKTEKIIVSETSQPLIYSVTCISKFSDEQPYISDALDVEESISFAEGAAQYKTHKSYERNQGVVTLAKKLFKENHQGKLYCEVCGFSFEDMYGSVGKNYIEAHHDIKPVSQMGNNGFTTISDLRMVCANCHRILHRKKPWMSVDQLKTHLKKQNTN